jgi:hypothetical protein
MIVDKPTRRFPNILINRSDKFRSQLHCFPSQFSHNCNRNDNSCVPSDASLSIMKTQICFFPSFVCCKQIFSTKTRINGNRKFSAIKKVSQVLILSTVFRRDFPKKSVTNVYLQCNRVFAATRIHVISMIRVGE